MKMTRRTTKVWSAALALFLSAGLACAKKKKSSDGDDAEEATTITVAGQLALTGEGASLSLLANPALTELAVYCVTFSIPPVAGTGSVAADGAFSLTLDAVDVSVGCFILKNTDILGTIVFEDPSKKSMAGGSQTSDRLAFGGGTSNLGTINLDLATGKAVVDITKIATSTIKDTSSAAAAAEDFTGTYKATSAGITLPTGYVGTCSMEQMKNGGADDCHGPMEGMSLFLKSIKGADVATGSPAYAMGIWQSESVFNLCGQKLGFSYEEGKTKAGIDFSASGVAEGAFAWDVSLVDGWKDPAARARYSMMKMENVDDFKGYPGMKQYFKQYRTFNCQEGQPCNPEQSESVVVAEGFQFNANTKDTGCKGADGKPIQLNDWGSMECTFEALSGASAGLHKNVCKKTHENQEITCTHIGGTFDAAGNAIQNAMTRYPEDYHVYAEGAYCDYNSDGDFDGDEWPEWSQDQQSCRNSVQISQGDLCSSISTSDEAGKLAQLRCYLEANHGGGKGGPDEEISSCRREVRGNWSAKTADEFLGLDDGPAKAQGQFVMELFKYDSATSGALRGEDKEFRGIQVGDNWTDCEVHNVFSMALRKIEGSNDLLAEMVESQRNVSSKPACVAEFGEGKTLKMLFKLVKQ